MVRRQKKALYGAVDKATTWGMPRFVGTMGVTSYCRLFMATISLLLCSLASSRFDLHPHPCRGMEPSLDDDMATRWLLVIWIGRDLGSTATPGRGGVRESESGT